MAARPKSLRTTAAYDRAISARLDQIDAAGPLPVRPRRPRAQRMALRYGENPHQSAAL